RRIRPTIRQGTTHSLTSHSQSDRQSQNLGDAPCLRKTPDRTLRWIAVKNLGNLSDTTFLHVVNQRRQPPPRLIDGFIRTLIYLQIGLEKRSDQPRPDRAVMVS